MQIHGKYETYRDVEHLMVQARCAMEQEDIRVSLALIVRIDEL